MNHQYSSKHTERHLQLWIYLLPIVGIVPAVWTLYRPQSKALKNDDTYRQQQKASRMSISLALLWLSSYSLLSWGATNVSEILSFRLLYANAIFTSGYFVTCTFLMIRSNKKSLSCVERQETITK